MLCTSSGLMMREDGFTLVGVACRRHSFSCLVAAIQKDEWKKFPTTRLGRQKSIYQAISIYA